MTKGERIKNLRERRGINQTALADKIDVSKQTLYKYENDIITNIPSDKIEALAEVLGTTPAYIMGWDDTTFSNIHPVKTRSFPVLGAVACGEAIYMSEEKGLYVDASSDIRADFVLIAHGDSMINARIHDGDIVFIRKQEEVENGEIAVVAIDDEATLKRFYKYADMIVLRAENPTFKDMVFTPSDHKEIRILGKAVAFQGNII